MTKGVTEVVYQVLGTEDNIKKATSLANILTLRGISVQIDVDVTKITGTKCIRLRVNKDLLAQARAVIAEEI